VGCTHGYSDCATRGTIYIEFNASVVNTTMKILKTEFRKNGLDYTLLKRTDKIALFQLGHLPDPDGYEVCRIYIMRPHKAFGVDFEEQK